MDRIDENRPPASMTIRTGWQLELKVIAGVVITNILYDFSGPFDIGRQFAIFDVFGKQVAQQAPEIFVSRIGQKAARVG